MDKKNKYLQPSFTKDDVSIISKKRRYQGFFAIDHYELKHKLFNGGYSRVLTREIFERDHNAVAILPYDAQSDEVVLIEQFRPGALNDSRSPWLIEIVAGMIDQDEGEIDACLRELYEESKLQAKSEDLHFVNKIYPSPGGTSEQVSIYIAKLDCSSIASYAGLAEENEDIRIFKLKAQEAFDLVKDNIICNCASVIALNYLCMHHESFKHL